VLVPVLDLQKGSERLCYAEVHVDVSSVAVKHEGPKTETHYQITPLGRFL
jgi:hypothetical protein